MRKLWKWKCSTGRPERPPSSAALIMESGNQVRLKCAMKPRSHIQRLVDKKFVSWVFRLPHALHRFRARALSTIHDRFAIHLPFEVLQEDALWLLLMLLLFGLFFFISILIKANLAVLACEMWTLIKWWKKQTSS